MAVRKHANGKWYVDIYVNGKRIVRSSKVSNRRAAEQLEARLKGRALDGRFWEPPKKGRETLAEFWTWYEEFVSARKKDHKTEISRIKPVLLHHVGKRLCDITSADIEDYRERRLGEETYKGTPPTPALINREFSLLRHVLNRAVAKDYIKDNPCRRVSQYRETGARDRVLTGDEYEKLLDAIPPHFRPVVIAGHETGMRLGEILNLRWAQIDQKDGTIKLASDDTKTSAYRTIPISPPLLRVIQVASGVRQISNDAVFTYRARPISESSFRHAFDRACSRTGIENLKFHDLRHTAITGWRRAGVDTLTAMAMSGHKSIQVFKRYNTVTVDDLHDAMAKVTDYRNAKNK